VPIRYVVHGQFEKCPKCGLVFLVSDLVGGAEVWHHPCETRLFPLFSVDDVESCVLAMVVMSTDNSRLEVRPGLGVDR
jgi:hypothetical protein